MDCDCTNITPCAVPYYLTNFWLFEQRGWGYSHVYNPFILYLFTHDVWFTLSLATLWEMLEELSVALSVWLDAPYLRLKQEWDQADTMYDLFAALIGIAFGILFVWTFNTPRLIQYPEEEALQVKYNYGLDTINEHEFNIHKKYPMRMYWWLRWKYFLEIFIIQWLPGRAWLFIPDNSGDTISEAQVLIREVFRVDWWTYVLINICFIWILWSVNWLTYLEREVFWKNDLKLYTGFHFAWMFVFILFMGPSAYMLLFPKMMVAYSSLLVLTFLICALVIVRFGPLPCFLPRKNHPPKQNRENKEI